MTAAVAPARPVGLWHPHLIDDAVLVSDDEAVEETRRLNRAGYPVGPSSGTKVTIARRFAARGVRILTFFPEAIDCYRSLEELRDP